MSNDAVRLAIANALEDVRFELGSMGLYLAFKEHKFTFVAHKAGKDDDHIIVSDDEEDFVKSLELMVKHEIPFEAMKAFCEVYDDLNDDLNDDAEYDSRFGDIPF